MFFFLRAALSPQYIVMVSWAVAATPETSVAASCSTPLTTATAWKENGMGYDGMDIVPVLITQSLDKSASF
jgi:hypothetical protein